MKRTKATARKRPVSKIIQPIKDSPEQVAKVNMQASPKIDWDYLKNTTKRK